MLSQQHTTTAILPLPLLLLLLLLLLLFLFLPGLTDQFVPFSNAIDRKRPNPAPSGRRLAFPGQL